MRVAIVQSTPVPPTEGIGNHTSNLARQLRNRGHDPHVFTRGGWTGSSDSLDGIPVTRPPCPPLYPLHAHLHRIPLQRAITREGPFDVVHLHSPLVPLPDVSAPTVSTIHTPIENDVDAVPAGTTGERLLRLQVPFSQSLERRLVRESDEATTVSESIRGLLDEQYHRRIDVVHNGVDADECRPADARDDDSLLYVGRLGRRKGLPRLLTVAEELRDRGVEFTLAIAGQGPLESELDATVCEKDLEGHVEVLGYVDRDELLGRFRRAAVLVHLPEFEGLPTTVLEAMASETPVVATDVPGCRDAVEDGHTGVLVPKDDVGEITDAILELLEAPRRRRELGENARTSVEANFDWELIAAKYESVYWRAID